MALALTEEQKQIKRQQDDLKKRKGIINHPTNIQLGQEVPLIKEARVPDVVGKAQEKATTGFQSPIQGDVNKLASQFVKDPSLGADPTVTKEAALAKFDQGQAKSIEAFRRSTGGIAGSSDRNEELLKRFSDVPFQRAQLEATLDQQAADKKRADMISAIDVGQKSIAQQEQTFRNDITSMLQTAEGARGFEALSVQEKIAYAEMASRERIQLSDQQYQSTRDALSQAHETAMQSNDIEASREALKKELDFRESQSQLGREFTKEQSALDRAMKESLAYLDIEGQRELVTLRGKLDSDMLLTEQDFKGAEAALNRALEQELQKKSIESQERIQLAQNEFNAAQGELNRATERYKVDKSIEAERQLQEAQNNFNSAENNLSRAHESSLQETSIQSQHDLLNAQNNFDLLKQENQQKWLSTERMATQAFATEERLSAEDHNRTLQYFEHKNQEAIANADISAQLTIQDMKSSLALKMQTQEMGQQEKMMYLSAELEEAKAGNDFERQKSLTKLQTMEQMKLLQKENEYAESLTVLQNNLEQSLKNNDFAQAKVLQQMKHNQELMLQYNDNLIAKAELELKKQGIDLEKDFREWSKIQEGINSGALNPDAALKYLQQNLPPNLQNIIQPPDPFAVQTAIQEDFLNQQLQYALVNKESGIWENGIFKGLTDEAQNGFNKWFNDNFFSSEENVNNSVTEIIKKSNKAEKNSGPVGPGPKPGPITQGPGPEGNQT